MNDVIHVLLPQSSHYAEEELAFLKLVGELLLGGKVIGEQRVLHGIITEVLHGELLFGRDLEADDLVLLEMELFVGHDVTHEA